ncbi:hypothetical protein PV325_012064 [Microctonus aethiopoides]|nr:hypothetical protein PV325_012064 [Microctonus aethiopoides]KAK0093704.1 hypothetical protein PV326_012859 [Microctonus aethiopoides]
MRGLQMFRMRPFSPIAVENYKSLSKRRRDEGRVLDKRAKENRPQSSRRIRLRQHGGYREMTDEGVLA